MTSKAKTLGWMPVVTLGLIVLLVYVAWAVAFWQLGRRPVPSMDDPKYMGGISSVVSGKISVVIAALLLGWAASVVGTAIAGLCPKTAQRSWWWRQFALGLVGMALLLVSARYSPGAAVTWFLD